MVDKTIKVYDIKTSRIVGNHGLYKGITSKAKAVKYACDTDRTFGLRTHKSHFVVVKMGDGTFTVVHRGYVKSRKKSVSKKKQKRRKK